MQQNSQLKPVCGTHISQLSQETADSRNQDKLMLDYFFQMHWKTHRRDG